MILLLGGTSETRPIATAIAESGTRVTVSTATDNPLDVGVHPLIIKRSGRLDEHGLRRLIREQGIRLLLDATHPFAEIVHTTAQKASAAESIPYLRFERSRTEFHYEKAVWADGHTVAAQKAFSFGRPVFLMTGSRNLTPYMECSKDSGIEFVVRVLPHPESEEACKRAGVPQRNVIAARGPFSAEDNLEIIRRFNIGTIVTKDSGAEGGLAGKVEAARQSSCHLVIIQRPSPALENVFHSVDAVVATALKMARG